MKKGLVILIVMIVLFLTMCNLVQNKKVVTIKGVDHKLYGKTDTYLVFTDSAGVLENTDSWLFFKFNSSDVQGTLMDAYGKKFEITYAGFRMPLFSTYPNIISVKQVK